jgi:hypothetical protein
MRFSGWVPHAPGHHGCISEVKPIAVERWLNEMPVAPGSFDRVQCRRKKVGNRYVPSCSRNLFPVALTEKPKLVKVNGRPWWTISELFTFQGLKSEKKYCVGLFPVGGSPCAKFRPGSRRIDAPCPEVEPDRGPPYPLSPPRRWLVRRGQNAGHTACFLCRGRKTPQ